MDRDELEARGTWVEAIAVKVSGSPPCRVGNRLRVFDTGVVAGTLGCAEFDAKATRDAPEILAAGEPQTRTYTHDLGSVEVYLEPRTEPAHLVVVSATGVSLELLLVGRRLGYSCSLVEARTERISPDHRSAASLVTGSMLEVKLHERADVVFTDHDAPALVDLLAVVLRSPARFIGVMGSKRHTGAHMDELRSVGFSDEDLARVHTPVGLDIGANTPSEIAISIAAGLVASLNERSGGWLDARGG